VISADDIGVYFQDPRQIPESAIGYLSALCDKYPYSSSLHILYLKGLSLHQGLGFEEMLKRSSAHAVDREQLHFVISEEATQVEIQGLQDTSDQPIVSEAMESKEPPIREVSIELADEKDVITGVEDASMDPRILVETGEDEEIQHEEVLKEIEKESGDEEIRADDVNEVEDEVEANDKAAEDRIEEINKGGEERAEVEIDYENLTFIQWLKLKQGKPIDESEDVYFEEVESEKDEDLVDKFIREEPSLSKPTKEFYDPVKNAKESLDESSDIVSETLAEVHIQQKNFGKAIETYQKLMLTYPEKKAIFASRIKEINASLR
jgi:hypothetical protein